MTHDTKVAVILREDLPIWQKLNVTAVTISGIVGTTEGIIGENYEDASGNQYLPMINQPIMIFSANAEQIKKTHERALIRNVKLAIFTEEIFSAIFDEDSRSAVKKCSSEDLNLIGMAMRDDKRVIDKVIKGLTLHK